MDIVRDPLLEIHELCVQKNVKIVTRLPLYIENSNI